MIIDLDIEKLLKVFPDTIKNTLRKHKKKTTLIEVVMDLGRRPEGRFLKESQYLSKEIVSWQDIDYTTKRLGKFSHGNRAGIEGSLHRISCIRNRQGIIIGLSCRIGRCVLGSIGSIRDVLDSDESLLILGKPGLGKTTLIREISRVLSDEVQKRVVIVDTANEIAGDSDIMHPGIGQARRMQASPCNNQENLMVEAIENHMPQVIVVDEIGTELEALAARTIAERGVKLVGTAHGNSLENLIKNPRLSDLIGGIHSVTLSDEEARRRKSQKTVLERKSLPAFPLAIELNEKNTWTIHEKVQESVDNLLKRQASRLQSRSLVHKGFVKIEHTKIPITGNTFLKTKKSSRKTSFSKKSKPKPETLKSFPKKQKKLIKIPLIKLCKQKFKKRILKKKYIYLGIFSISSRKLISKSLNAFPSTTTTKVLQKAEAIFLPKLYLKQSSKFQNLAIQEKIPVYILQTKKKKTGQKHRNLV